MDALNIALHPKICLINDSRIPYEYTLVVLYTILYTILYIIHPVLNLYTLYYTTHTYTRYNCSTFYNCRLQYVYQLLS